MRVNIGWIIVASLLYAPVAFAGIGVAPPYVKKDHGALFSDGFYTPDEQGRNIRLRNRLTYDYGLTERAALRLRAIFEDRNHVSSYVHSYEISAKYQLNEKGQWPLDVGFYGGVLVHTQDNTDHALLARLLLAKEVGKWMHSANIVFSDDIGQNISKSSLELRLHHSYELSDNIRMGAEYFGGFGTLENVRGVHTTKQRAGPFLSYRFNNKKWRADLVPLFGLNRHTEDVLLKWRFGFSF